MKKTGVRPWLTAARYGSSRVESNMQEQARQKELPEYEKPPLIESVLGIQFDPLPGLTTFHLGAFWKTLDSAEWPTVLEVPALPPQFERFDESVKWGVLGIQLQLNALANRMQIKNRKNDRMVQIQNGRLHFNWLGEAGGQYPRYENIREGFVSLLQRFMDFVKSENLGDFRPNQWEVTYLNHIPKGTVWDTPKDWDFFRALRGISVIEDIVKPESFGGEWHFILPGQRGRLHVAWQHGARPGPDAHAIIVLTLTARGALDPGRSDIQNLLDSLDFGRDIIVRSFEMLMSKKANEFWGLKHAGR